ncbi:hypothetical protein D9757_011662 [Collybiopsis confluens]|uniref:O-methyltransferase C-terminal domain-containing protein n=1 Tax=Collybiopsis confluens TaxID=2823264 RepID=A0A8H5LQ93_9AGAR|nr:hypothetical protein D9757_011662 [Collybiopsis confluens]
MASTLIELCELISASVRTVDARCTALSASFPDLNKTDNTEEDQRLLRDDEIAKATSIALAAASQLIASMQFPTRSILDASLGFLTSAAVGVVAEASITEIIREAGPQGCHVDDIAKKNGMSALNIARVLRPLATQHIFREVSPNVFANNRISILLDTGKSYEEIAASPENKHERAAGYASLIQLNTDETFKGAAYIQDVVTNRNGSDDELNSPLNRAFGTNLDLFSWYGQPNNKLRFKRFGMAMDASRRMSPPGAVLKGFEWSALAKNALIVDVGGGIGSVSLEIARANPDLRFLIQEKQAVVQEGKNYWEVELPGALSSGRVSFEAHDFFTPQPVKNAGVFMIRFICHNWSDSYLLKILKHLRDAAQSTTKLIVIEHPLHFVCGEDESFKHIPGAFPAERPPKPLLPNMGIVGLPGYLIDMQHQMMALLRGCERTFPHYWKLLREAGWEIEEVHHLPGTLVDQIVAKPL